MALALTVALTHVLRVNVREGEELREGLWEGEELGDALSPPRSVGYGGADIVPAR